MSDAFSDCASDDIDRIRARRKRMEIQPVVTTKKQFIAYRWADDSVSVFVLIKEKLPYQQMSVKYPDSPETAEPMELDNWGDYIICDTLKEAKNIQTKAKKYRQIIRRDGNKLDNLFKTTK